MVLFNDCSNGYGKCFKISNTFLCLFSNEMLLFKAGIHKFLVKIIANRGDLDQTAAQSDLALRGLSKPFWQKTSARNFRTFTVWSSCNKDCTWIGYMAMMA